MTHTIGGAPQSQMTNKMAHASASHGGRRNNHTDVTNAEAKVGEGEAFAKDSETRTQRADRTSPDDATAKAESSRPFRKVGGQGKDAGATDTFAATIDDLDPNPETRSGKGDTSSSATDVTPWSVGAFAQIALARLAMDDSGSAASVKTAEDGIARHLEISRSARAPLDAADRIALRHSDTPKDAMIEETLTTSVTVNARETHWLFPDRKTADAGVAVAHADRGVAGKIAPQDAFAAKAQDLMQKPSATGEKSAAGGIAQTEVVSDAPRRQAFDGQRDSGGRSREQSNSGPDDRRSAALGATSKTERATLDTTAPTTGTTGVTQQLKTGILNALTGASGDTTAPRVAAFQTTDDRPTKAGQVLRAIDITLSPPDLGTVKLRLTLRSNALDIDAEASKASTAKMLNDDRTGLEQSLRDSGYDVSSLKIADTSASSSINLNGANPQNGGDPRGNYAGRQDADQQRREGAPSGQSQQRSSDERSDKRTNEAGTRKTSGIYI